MHSLQPNHFLNQRRQMMVQPQFCPPCPPPHYQVQPQPPLHSNRRRKRGNGKNELDKDTEIKHGKTCHHWATGRNCLKGSRCLFVHGWVNPAKSGICRNHRLGQCFYTERACYFQHLHIPIEEYEKLAIGTSNYQQLEAKVNKRLAEQGKNSKGIRKDAPTDGTLAALRNASTTFDRDQKVSVSQQSTWAICPPVQKRGALWSETSEGKGLIERGLFKREKSIEADGLLNNIRAWRLGGKTNINMDSAYPKKMHEEDLDSPGPMLLSSRKTVPSSEKMEQNVEIVKRELVIQDDLSVASSTDSTGSTGTEELTILKPIKDWTVNDVFHFVSTLNTAPWWKQYADVLKRRGRWRNSSNVPMPQGITRGLSSNKKDTRACCSRLLTNFKKLENFLRKEIDTNNENIPDSAYYNKDEPVHLV